MHKYVLLYYKLNIALRNFQNRMKLKAEGTPENLLNECRRCKAANMSLNLSGKRTEKSHIMYFMSGYIDVRFRSCCNFIAAFFIA